MRNLLFILCVLFVFSACHTKEKEKAQDLLKRIENSFQDKKYNTVKLQIDSMNNLYRRELTLRKKANEFLYKTELIEKERNLSYLSAQIPLKKIALDSLLQYFVFDKVEAYQETGEFVHKNVAKEKNAIRTYLKTHVKENGDIFLISIYSGYRDCIYQQVKLKNGNFFVFSPTVGKDETRNYIFKDNVYSWRMLLFDDTESEDMISFIASQYDTEIIVELDGDKCAHRYVLEKKYKEAIRDSYFLSSLIKDINRMTTDADNIKKQIEHSKEKIASLK